MRSSNTARPTESPEHAERWGLVNRTVPATDLDGVVRQWCHELIARAPLTMARYKATLQRGSDRPRSAALRSSFSPDPYESEDRLEGIAAFVEKRQPVWKGR